jgi:hypothetical protein
MRNYWTRMASATTTTRHGTLYFDEPETLIFEVRDFHGHDAFPLSLRSDHA